MNIHITVMIYADNHPTSSSSCSEATHTEKMEMKVLKLQRTTQIMKP